VRIYFFDSDKLPTIFPSVTLTKDSWDDFGRKTTFKAIYWQSGDVPMELGTIKLLKKGQARGSTEVPRKIDEPLGEEYCSLGQNLEYYEKLRNLGRKVYRPILTFLRDVAYDPTILAEFEDDRGFKDSLLRSTAAESALGIAPSFFRRLRDTSSADTPQLKFKTQVGGTGFAISFDFKGEAELPGRLNVVIGYNGTGKTQLLANLAMAAATTSSSKDAPDVGKRYGRFLDEKPSFGAVIAISYSAFDTFDLPGQNAAQRKRVAQEGEWLGYTYCGLRDLAQSTGTKPDRLKSFSQLAEDFEQAIEALSTKNRFELFLEMVTPIGLEPSLQRIGMLRMASKDVVYWAELFAGMSSGHKIVLNIVAHLAAYLQRGSLVLIDEPEAHLHPPLLAALMKSLRVGLSRRDSYAIIATHSPVILQETPAKFVRIVRRLGDSTSVSQPKRETFGENIGI
jgi:hypothetical protein